MFLTLSKFIVTYSRWKTNGYNLEMGDFFLLAGHDDCKEPMLLIQRP
jgi:hypothetical protein